MTTEAQRKAAQARLQHVQDNPDAHRHDFAGLYACSTVDGVLDTSIIEAHEGLAGPTHRCDVSKGPCACGATH